MHRGGAILLLVLLAGCAAPSSHAPAALAPPAGTLTCPTPCAVAIAKDVQAAREPLVVADPRNPTHLLVATMEMRVTGDAVGQLALRLDASRDGGATWTEQPIELGGPADTESYDPALAMLPDGTPIVGAIALAGAYSPVGMVQGNARLVVGPVGAAPLTVVQGRGLEGAALLPGGAAALVAPDKPGLAAAPDGSLLLAYALRERATPADPGTTRVALAISKDRGASWTDLPQPRVESDAVPGQPIALSAGGWAVPFAQMETPDAFANRAFRCGVALVGADAAVLDLGPCGWIPALAARNGTLAAALTVPTAAGPATELRLTNDQGATWRTVRIDTPQSQGESVPSLVAAGADAWIATYFHPLDVNVTTFRAALVEGDAVRGTVVVDPRIERQPTQVGDVFGLAALPDGAYATWVGATGDVREVMGARLANR